MIPSRDELAGLSNWAMVKKAYQHLRFETEPAEDVERYAVERHKLSERLPNLEAFWRFHIAPATKRPGETHLRDDIRPVVSRLAERSYEVFCNVSDALDELAIVQKGLAPPRYRPCLNVLRFSGDALMLFDGLTDTLTKKDRPSVARELDVDIELFRDWHTGQYAWKRRRDAAVAHRNMLVHHGRPWLHFLEGDPTPYILKAEHCRQDGSKIEDRQEFLTWQRQIKKFNAANQRDKFITLPDACQQAVDRTIDWLDDAYGRVIERLDDILSADTARFVKYRELWGLSAMDKRQR